MRRAIALTAHCPRLPIGALIVCAETDEVVAEGWNRSAIKRIGPRPLHDGGAVPHVPGGHPLERHWHGGVRLIDPLPASPTGTYLDTFVRSVSCSLFRIDILRYLYVTRFQEVRQGVPKSRA